MLAQAPDHQWYAGLHQLLRPPSEVGDWAALSAASVPPPEPPVLLQLAVDCDFAATAAYVDSASSRPTEPLYIIVRRAVHLWQALGANKMVLDWILNGVHFPLSLPPRPFIIPGQGAFCLSNLNTGGSTCCRIIWPQGLSRKYHTPHETSTTFWQCTWSLKLRGDIVWLLTFGWSIHGFQKCPSSLKLWLCYDLHLWAYKWALAWI